MINDLPISIFSSDILIKKFVKIASIVVKHEAHFNFQTLAAGWYEKEDDILNIDLTLLSLDEFHKKTELEQFGIKTEIADDVLSYFFKSSNKVTCFIALTDAEEELIIQQPKLLANYIKIKLLKVLNCIATEHNKVLLS